ncbi:serine/threonine-protein kinase [Roseofilum casamattae]|uniref:Serine/threonine-protein kinase n=1 Tax=Roseofilum casamattae BLCC-M143 TaxID=3022442 RepID=A0ABT7BWA9_9CYAN|nr:serine/threonine-protein kinase [Roseofilum casamattae]MDJ1183461.1 serine/threonine-protein kinase [Roseofilum casamattae BLCC-M143]
MSVHQKQTTKYRVLGLVGQGQFGRVFCGCHRQTGKVVALKDLDKHRFPTRQFLRELRFLLQLSHPNIVTCTALEHYGKRRYLVMDYCEGGTLRNWMDRQSNIPLALAFKFMQDVLQGLEHANNRGIVHRDLKPENILLTLKSQGWIARISDFGIARLIQESGHASDNTGSPAYMAPERFYGQYSLRSDIYAVGVMLYELIVGDRPFSGPPQKLMMEHLNRRLVLPDRIPPPLQAVIGKALEKLPARRYSSATEMSRALDRIQESLRLSKSPLPLSFFPPPSLPLSRSAIVTETLPEPISALAISGLPAHEPNPWVYWTIGDRVQCWQYGDRFNFKSLKNVTTVTLPEPIRHLKSTARGCFAITEHCVYYLNPQLSSSFVLSAELVAHLPHSFQVDINRQGTWMAAIENQKTLFIWDGKFHLNSTPHKLPIAENVTQIQLLDRGHGVLWRSDEKQCSIELFTRRRSFAGHWKLPIAIGQVIQGTLPYRVLVIPKEEHQTALLMDLKPFRIRPIPIKLRLPVCAAIAPWGYILANWEGHLTLLDEFGQIFGRIPGPSCPIALTAISKTLLLVSTDRPNDGQLHLLDLTQFDLNFIF